MSYLIRQAKMSHEVLPAAADKFMFRDVSPLRLVGISLVIFSV